MAIDIDVACILHNLNEHNTAYAGFATLSSSVLFWNGSLADATTNRGSYLKYTSSALCMAGMITARTKHICMIVWLEYKERQSISINYIEVKLLTYYRIRKPSSKHCMHIVTKLEVACFAKTRAYCSRMQLNAIKLIIYYIRADRTISHSGMNLHFYCYAVANLTLTSSYS